MGLLLFIVLAPLLLIALIPLMILVILAFIVYILVRLIGKPKDPSLIASRKVK